MDAELIFWIVLLVIAVIGVALFLHDWNWRSPEADDPYRYCPKEEDEW